MAISNGGIAFVALNTPNNQFSFIALEDIAAGEEIIFSDAAYDDDTDTFGNSNVNATSERFQTYTSTGLSAGDVVTLTHIGNLTDGNQENVYAFQGSTSIDDAGFETLDGITSYLAVIGTGAANTGAGGDFGDFEAEGANTINSDNAADDPLDQNDNPIADGADFLYYDGGLDGFDGLTPAAFNNPANWVATSSPAAFNANAPTADTVFTNVTVCFLEGTLISTSTGEKKVESLEEGDLIITEAGHEVAVKWMGRQTVVAAFAVPERTAPILIKQGALGENTPNADLYVTADHGMVIDGIIAHASALVNGDSIVRVPLTEMEEKFTFWHIETEKHEVILANGAPAETFIDNVTRKVFDNYEDFASKFGTDVPEMEELDMLRALSQRQLPAAIKAKLGIAVQKVS